MDPEERDLVRAARSGDDDAFGRLVEKTQSRLTRLLRGIVRDDDEAMDLVQETYIKAHRSLDTFREGSAFGTWLHRIGVNAAIDHLRKRTAFSAASLEDAGPWEGVGEDPAGTSDRPTPDRLLEGEEAGKTLRRALDSMPPEHKATILLRELEGLSYDEIAEITGAVVGTVMSRLFYVRRKLRDALREHR